jgi:hypothetical protein
MTTDQTDAIAALLTKTEGAHGEYEATELKGVYDQDWPRWYAEYAVARDIGTLLGRAITADELTQLLETSWEEFQKADPRPTDSWTAFTARLIAARSS